MTSLRHLTIEKRELDFTQPPLSSTTRKEMFLKQLKQQYNNIMSASTSNNTSSQPPKHVISRFVKKRPADLYGQRHTIETLKCISDSLRLLEKELQKIPQDERSGIEQASIICPEIYASKEHRLLFLQCEQFNADVSIIWVRYVSSYLSQFI